MARTPTAIVQLPGANVDACIVELEAVATATDAANDHVSAEDPAPGDLLVIYNFTSSMTVSHQAYTNRYGRPSTPAVGKSDGPFSNTLFVMLMPGDMDGMLNGSGQVEFNVDAAGGFACLLRG
jgi:hypothetical protein